LLLRYGTYAARVIADLAVWGDEPLEHHPGYSVGEVRSLIAREWVVTLSDIVHRRTSLAFSGQLSHSLLSELAQIMASERGWSADDIAREIMSITVEEGSSQWVLS
jgi:glycerol-3-phosphate dehydrogenase